MSLSQMRLDRFLRSRENLSKFDIRSLLAQGRIEVDGLPATDIAHPINFFSQIRLDGTVLQDNSPYYVMLHKPLGTVSATQDDQHLTLIDLLDYEFKQELHIAGRLDLNSSGMVLLTNDSRWSRKLTQPGSKVKKRYRVELEKPLSENYVEAFAEGMYFAFEDLTTAPVELNIIDTHLADVVLTEGRYHQIKRMFGRFRNPVKSLHRYAIGGLELDANLAVGKSRMLTKEESQQIFSST